MTLVDGVCKPAANRLELELIELDTRIEQRRSLTLQLGLGNRVMGNVPPLQRLGCSAESEQLPFPDEVGP